MGFDASDVPADGAKADFFVLRTPILPFDRFKEWGSGLAAATSRPNELEEAIAVDRAGLRATLRATFDRPDVREALFIASPILEQQYDRWVANPDSSDGRKIERALTLYFTRMCSRCTPFGLFAGCSVGTIGDATRLSLDSQRFYRRHVRLDSGYVASIVEALRFESGCRRVALRAEQ